MEKYFISVCNGQQMIGCLDEMTGDHYYFPLETLKNILNKQDNTCNKLLAERNRYKRLLLTLIGKIDFLMHDKDYRFLNEDGTWASREACRDLSDDEMIAEISEEINQLYNKLEEEYDKRI